MDTLINLQRTENGLVLLPFPGNFYELSGQNHCDPASVTVLYHYITT